MHQGKIAADIVLQNDDCIAIRDINPQAPTHILVIPKKHIATINDLSTDDAHIVFNSIELARQVAIRENIHEVGYRLVWNVNEGAGQTVFHLHLHVLGGRYLTWPPG
jgi:histidine triad (HIT) family protein